MSPTPQIKAPSGEFLQIWSIKWQLYLIGTGGLVGAVVIAEVLVGLGRLGLSVDAGVGLVHRRDVMAQGDGFHSFVDATAHALADFGTRCLGLARRRGAACTAAGGLRGHLT